MTLSPVLVGILLSVISALGWATLDILRKPLGARLTPEAVMLSLLVWQVPLLGAFTLWQASSSPGGLEAVLTHAASFTYLWRTLASVALNVWANDLLVRGMQISPLSLTLPYLAFTPVFTSILSVFVFGEVPVPMGWIGIVLVSLGGAFLSSDPKDFPMGLVRALARERGSALTLLVAALWSVTTILDKGSSAMTLSGFHAWMLVTGMTVGFAIVVALRRASGVTIAHALRVSAGASPRLASLAGISMAVAMATQFLAFERLPVGVIEVLKRATGALGALLIGYLVFHERGIARRLPPVVVMLTGVALILFAR